MITCYKINGNSLLTTGLLFRGKDSIARELFASDILASKSEELEHEFEQYEKRLLRISEALELRGSDMDNMHREVVWQHNEADLDTALLDILDMTLTVVDGDFSTQVIRRDNLYFRNYEMPAERNNMLAYSAVSYSKGSALDGEVWIKTELHKQVIADARTIGQLPFMEARAVVAREKSEKHTAAITMPVTEIVAPAGVVADSWPSWLVFVLGVICSALGVVVYNIARKRKATCLLLTMCISLLAIGSNTSAEVISGRAKSFSDPAMAKQDIDKLVQEKACRQLQEIASDSMHPVAQGWAIVGLIRVDQSLAKLTCDRLRKEGSSSKLLQTWALAGIFHSTSDAPRLASYGPDVGGQEALKVLLNKCLSVYASELTLSQMLMYSSLTPNIGTTLQPLVIASGIDELIEVMLTDEKDTIRRLAAGYLATIGESRPREVAKAYIDSFQGIIKIPRPGSDRELSDVPFPWQSGALYTPQIGWKKSEVQELVALAVEWWHLCRWPRGRSQNAQIRNLLANRYFEQKLGYDGLEYDALDWLADKGHVLESGRAKEIVRRRLNDTDRELYADELKRMNANLNNYEK